MIIRSLRQHWPARKLEWLMAGFLQCWGLYVLMHPELFTSPATAQLFAGMEAISSSFMVYPALAWGGVAFTVGFIRMIALLINGAWTRTPAIRLGVSFASMFVVTQMVTGLWQSGVPNTGLVVYPWLLFADLLSVYRSAVDVVHAAKQRQELKEDSSRANTRDSSSSRITA